MRVDSVGVVGLGYAGSAMARRLLHQGFAVNVHDRDPGRAAPLADAGARVGRLPADAAEEVDVVLVLVPDEPAAEEVLFECGGIGDTLRDGGVVVLAVPGAGPEFVRSAADRLAALGLGTAEAWRVHGGTRAPALVLVGGTPEVRAAVAPVLEALAAGSAGPVDALRGFGAAQLAVG
jgi:3-hydroxyisobutyrate dehydrogenase-like beta-hydroxyacid dehydrogenase